MLDTLPPRSAESPARHETPKGMATQLMVINRKISELKPYNKNARTHAKRQIEKIAATYSWHQLVRLLPCYFLGHSLLILPVLNGNFCLKY